MMMLFLSTRPEVTGDQFPLLGKNGAISNSKATNTWMVINSLLMTSAIQYVIVAAESFVYRISFRFSWHWINTIMQLNYYQSVVN